VVDHQAEVQGDDQQPPQQAGGKEQVEPLFPASWAQSSLGWRHYLHPDGRGLAVLGGGVGLVLKESDRLEHVRLDQVKFGSPSPASGHRAAGDPCWAFVSL